MQKTKLNFSRIFLLFLLVGSIGFFAVDDAFGQKYGDSSSDDNDDDKKDKDREKEERGNSDREQKGERTDRDEKEEDDDKIEEKEEKQQEKTISENQEDRTEEIRQQNDNDNNTNDDDNDKKQNKSEEKRAKLESDKKKIEEKQAEKAREFGQKLEKLKEKFQQKIAAEEKLPSDESIPSSFSMSSSVMTASEPEETKEPDKKSEKIREKLITKSERLDSRTLKILDKINEGKYMGEKIGPIKISDNYKLEFDSVAASGIGDKSLTSILTGNMIFTTFDIGKSDTNLKLQLEECDISVDDVPYHCGFGKARTVSSGQSGEKDSLVIIAFLEDGLVEELHTTLKIFLNSDLPISQIEAESEQQVSILGPQSKVSHMWFLNGTATLSKLSSVSDDVVVLENIREESTTSESESSGAEQKEQEEEEKEETSDDKENESNEN